MALRGAPGEPGAPGDAAAACSELVACNKPRSLSAERRRCSSSPPSPLRAGLLVLALALHAALEGLALGLQEAGGAALRLCLALLLHKGLVAFSLALQLLRGRLRRAAVAACLLLFALMAPLGVAVGLAVTVSGGGPRQRLCRSVLEGLAAGTFLYVAFLEVLPRELGGPRLRVPKVLALLAGFGLVTAVLFIRI
nr:zinc transporter ZIP1 [Anser cygnoides]